MRHVFIVIGFVATVIPALGGEGSSANAVNLGDVNTKGDEVDPFLTADGKRILYASNAAGTFDLMVSVREAINKPWSKGINIAKYNTKDYDERSPIFLSGGTLYFASDQVPDLAFKKLRNFDILRRSGTLAPFRLRIVCTKDDEMFPWVTARGGEFYFSRKTKDGWRLRVSKGPARGGPGESRLLKEFPPGFHHATLTPDGRTMFLEGPTKDKKSGIFRSTRKTAAGPWTKPALIVNLAGKNAKRGDVAPSISRDGKTLYFASDREGGQGGFDLWRVAVKELKTK